MKLKLNHIQHYPIGENGLKGVESINHPIYELESLSAEKFVWKPVYKLDDGVLRRLPRRIDCKPLLHPLSDLTKPIIVPGYNEGKEFVPVLELVKMRSWPENEDYDKLYTSSDGGMHIVYFNTSSPIDDIVLAVEEYDIKSSQYWVIEKLYQWHFAIDIPEGCWIDINTITK